MTENPYKSPEESPKATSWRQVGTAMMISAGVIAISDIVLTFASGHSISTPLIVGTIVLYAIGRTLRQYHK
jgi:hypothetical protein